MTTIQTWAEVAEAFLARYSGWHEVGGGDDFSWFRRDDLRASIFLFDDGHFEMFVGPAADCPADDQAPDRTGGPSLCELRAALDAPLPEEE